MFESTSYNVTNGSNCQDVAHFLVLVNFVAFSRKCNVARAAKGPCHEYQYMII
jgi:hypothetical protein